MGHMLKNYMEDYVESAIESLLEDLDCCRCDNCFYDIKAIALNNLPPKYVVTKQGQLYTKINFMRLQFDVDIISEVTKAAAIVARRPRHDDEEY